MTIIVLLFIQNQDLSPNFKWNAVFVVITNRDLLFYDLVPWTREAWAVPVHTIPLINTRFITHSTNPGLTMSSKSTNSGGRLVIPGVTDSITFTLRLGTTHGIDCRIMCAESHRDLATWGRLIVQGAHNAAIALKEICFCESTNPMLCSSI